MLAAGLSICGLNCECSKPATDGSLSSETLDDEEEAAAAPSPPSGQHVLALGVLSSQQAAVNAVLLVAEVLLSRRQLVPQHVWFGAVYLGLFLGVQAVLVEVDDQLEVRLCLLKIGLSMAFSLSFHCRQVVSGHSGELSYHLLAGKALPFVVLSPPFHCISTRFCSQGSLAGWSSATTLRSGLCGCWSTGWGAQCSGGSHPTRQNRPPPLYSEAATWPTRGTSPPCCTVPPPPHVAHRPPAAPLPPPPPATAFMPCRRCRVSLGCRCRSLDWVVRCNGDTRWSTLNDSFRGTIAERQAKQSDGGDWRGLHNRFQQEHTHTHTHANAHAQHTQMHMHIDHRRRPPHSVEYALHLAVVPPPAPAPIAIAIVSFLPTLGPQVCRGQRGHPGQA